MKEQVLTIVSNRPLTAAVYEMKLRGDLSSVTRPGQFVNLKLRGFFLRRPISVCDWEGDCLTLVYKVVGQGTAQMASLSDGETLSLLLGLGNGYDTAKSGCRPLLIGGGVGIPPLFGLAKRLAAEGKTVTAILGFQRKEEIFYEKEWEDLGVTTLLTTADGSAGQHGFVTDAISSAGSYTYTYACGPEPMLRAVWNRTLTGGQYSFEARMGCGFGACMGCSCPTIYGSKRICKDGPVLEKEEILWAK